MGLHGGGATHGNHNQSGTAIPAGTLLRVAPSSSPLGEGMTRAGESFTIQETAFPGRGKMLRRSFVFSRRQQCFKSRVLTRARVAGA